MNTAPDPPPYRRWLRGLLPPVVQVALLVGVLVYALEFRPAEADHDLAALTEWVREARVYRETLPGLLRHYLADPTPERADAITAHLGALGDVTKMYQGQLPLFPVIYHLEITWAPARPEHFTWDANFPRRDTSANPLRSHTVELGPFGNQQATLTIDYQLHAFHLREAEEERDRERLRWLTLALAAGVPLAVGWIYLFFKGERERELAGVHQREQLAAAEKANLEKELRLREAERQKQEAEQRALELKSQLYASIGIMAGSYAHNIKNLLVRPNDLLGRCLEADGLPAEQRHHLQEVQGTLHTVTERLQQILKTVQRDPTQSAPARLDLNALARGLVAGWEAVAREKWKLTLTAAPAAEPLLIDGDLSHLTQAAENLVFNARDAVFEMRNHLRDQARADVGLDAEARRQALIAAAAWKGAVTLRTLRDDAGRPALEVTDNGIGMTPDQVRRVGEAHYSTKRGNAVFGGNAAGMGLGLAFVRTILEHHHAELAITSRPKEGTTFRLTFPVPKGEERG